MRNLLKKINLSLIILACSTFIVSCDKEKTVSFDYRYDGLTSVPTAEIDIEKARKIQRTGVIEELAIDKIEYDTTPVPVTVSTPESSATEETDNVEMDMPADNSSDTVQDDTGMSMDDTNTDPNAL